MADATVLKTVGLIIRTGSSPVSGTTAECRKPAFDWAGSVCLTAKLTAKIMKRVVHPPSSSSSGNSVSISAVASRIVSGVGWGVPHRRADL